MTGALVTARSRALLGQAPAWLFPALLALPFLIGIAVLKGLTVEIDTFHGSDARVYQLPTILQLSDRLDFSGYPSAQTPLYHVLTAWWGELVGFDLWKLRLLNVAFSYGAALALLRLLRRATPLEPWQAFALTLMFTLSPYFFGASFTLLTDNLAILFALLALERINRFRSDASLATFGVACVWIAGAVLTRQSSLWLVPVAAWFLLRSTAPVERRLAGAALLALALAPLAALVVDWGGLVPPTADPASCGLCTDRPGVGRDSLTLRTVGFTVALIGAYAALVIGPRVMRGPARLLAVPGGAVALAAGAGVLLLAISPLVYKPIVPGQAGDAGYLWQISDRLPVVLGSSLAFWLLVPLGCVAIFVLVRRAGVGSLPAVYLAAFLIAALPVGLVYQKYFDPFALLALALLIRPPDLRTRWDYAGIAVLCVAFVAYAISFAG
jgi:hypothetical protein